MSNNLMAEPMDLPSLDGGGIDYKKTLLDLVIGYNRMREQLDEVANSIEEFRKERKEERFTRKDIILTIIGSVGSVAIMFTGLFFLIGTQVSPVSQEFHLFEAATNDRFKQVTEIYNDRLRSLADAIQANRNVNIEQDKEINDIRLQNAATAARMDREGHGR